MKIYVNGPIISDTSAWIYDFFGIPCCCPKHVKENLAKAKSNEIIDVYINSGGGEIFAGSEIYSMLRDNGNVKIHVTGIAASAASVIACAGQSDISPTAMLMVHNVTSTADGDYHVMDKNSETLKKANEAIASAYIDKTGMSKEEALKLMDKETWLSAEDAVKYGFIDKVSEIKNQKLVASLDSGMIPQQIIDKMMSEKANKFSNDLAKSKYNFLKLKGEIL